jgi:magnesium transporter
MSEIHANTKIRKQSHNNVTWVDVESPGHEALAELEHDYSLHPMHLHECVQKVQHALVEREDNYLFLVLHVPVQTAHTDKLHITQIGVFLGKNFLVTVRGGASPCITDPFEVCNLSADKAEEYFKRGAAYLLYRVINYLLSDISEMTDDVNNELDGIEDIVFDNTASDAMRIGRVRQKIVRLSRIIGPKRFLFQDLTEQIDSFTGQNMAKYYAINTKMVNKLWEEVEEAKETVEVFKDADFTTSTEKTNRILAVLTLIFTFTIPVSVVAALYGMNVLLPGGIETGAWTFWGKYTSFIVIILASTGIALGMYWYFRKKKWF